MLNSYGRPFHQRATEMVVPPLSPADVLEMLAVPAADALDAYLVSGGLPLILDEWPAGATVMDYLADALMNPTSALLVSGERALAAEFPLESQARLVLGAIGAGERAYSLIARATGGISQASLGRALQLLAAKRLVEATTPLSTRPSRETRYAVADPYLRFWLSFVGPYLPEIERGRGDLTLARVRRSWTSWRGGAIEPVVRESMRRLPGDQLPAGTNAIGGYWTRTNDPEVDIVGADREPVATAVTMVGSIKWQERRPFDDHDLARLVLHRSQVPGTDEMNHPATLINQLDTLQEHPGTARPHGIPGPPSAPAQTHRARLSVSRVSQVDIAWPVQPWRIRPFFLDALFMVRRWTQCYALGVQSLPRENLPFDNRSICCLRPTVESFCGRNEPLCMMRLFRSAGISFYDTHVKRCHTPLSRASSASSPQSSRITAEPSVYP
jgi:DNA-binding transcriptional ArsR family regulator